MTNREKIANMAMYDMLLTMNENCGKRCVLEQLGADPVERCSKEVFCRDCIARWLNEEHDE